MWVPPEEKDPILLHAPTRKSISVFGAVKIDTGRLLTRSYEVFNTMTFFDFLEYILERTRSSRVIHLILDNSRYHHAKLLKPWLNEHRGDIVLDFLPPYSPELNPIERVWKLTRRLCVHNRYFPELKDLTSAVDNQFKMWNKPNATLKRLCAVI